MSRLLILLGNSGGLMALLCAIHCALTPIVLVLFPALAGNWMESESAEWGILILSFLFGGYMMLKGFSQHKNKRPVLNLTLAFGLFFLNHLFFHDNTIPQIVLSLAGGFFIITAQVQNTRLQKACACVHHA